MVGICLRFGLVDLEGSQMIPKIKKRFGKLGEKWKKCDTFNVFGENSNMKDVYLFGTTSKRYLPEVTYFDCVVVD